MLEFLRNWRRRRKLRQTIVSDTLWKHVEAQLPFLDYLPAETRPLLRHRAREFLAEKEFHGAGGLQLTDDIVLAIALQACLPVLHRGLEAYRDWVGVIVYPGDFVVPRREIDEDGVVHEFDDEILGEAWEAGPVVVSWHDGMGAPDGVNVVIHEFAHKLDMSNGVADGFPPLPPGLARSAWAHDFEAAFTLLGAQLDAGRPTALDPYAGEHPAEFFAVASEAFFETPLRLQEGFPAIYEQLKAFYRVDTAAGARREQEREALSDDAAGHE